MRPPLASRHSAGGGPSWLFELTTLAPDAAATGEQLLTLAAVAETVLGFIDRLDRQVMAMSTADFASTVGVLADDSPSAPLAVGAWQR